MSEKNKKKDPDKCKSSHEKPSRLTGRNESNKRKEKKRETKWEEELNEDGSQSRILQKNQSSKQD